MDQILGMNGAITYATVLFYIANEGLSILENCAELGVLVPANLAAKLKVVESQKVEAETFKKVISEELTGSKVDAQLEAAKDSEK